MNWKEELNLEGEEVIAINIKGVLYENEMLDEGIKRLDREFDGEYGNSEGESFWAWTKNKIFFYGVYDGSEWVDSLPRNPSIGIPEHIGGE